MPVSPESLARVDAGEVLETVEIGTPLPRSKDILLLKEETRLWPLTDIVVPPSPARRVFSIGDLVIAVGIGAFVVGQFLKRAGQRDAKHGSKLRWRQCQETGISRPHNKGPHNIS